MLIPGVTRQLTLAIIQIIRGARESFFDVERYIKQERCSAGAISRACNLSRPLVVSNGAAVKW